MRTNTALAKYQTVVEIVRIYEKAQADIEEGFALVAGAEKALNNTFSKGSFSTIRCRGRYDGRGINFNKPEDAMLQLKRDVWARIVDRLELRRIMSISRWKKLQKTLDEGELPEITVESVMAFGQDMTDHLGTMLDEAVTEVFEFLRPPRSEYKTNTELEIGQRVIINYGCEQGYRNEFRASYRYSQNYQALERVFQALDGQGVVSKYNRSELEMAIADSPDGRGETKYFEFKCFKKGTIHLKFKRMDLVKRLNEVAGGKRLKPSRRTLWRVSKVWLPRMWQWVITFGPEEMSKLSSGPEFMRS